MILKEMYGSTGIQTDTQLPQQTLSIERASASPSLMSSSTKCDEIPPLVPVMGMDPTAPISERAVGPPPKSGFIKKSWSKWNRLSFVEEFDDKEGQGDVQNHGVARDQVDAGIVPDINASYKFYN